MAKTRKTVTMSVTVSCPTWLPAAAARKEVRTLINNQTHWGYRNGLDEIDEYNFRARSVRP